MHLRWIEGSNDQNETWREIIGYAVLLLVLFVVTAVAGTRTT